MEEEGGPVDKNRVSRQSARLGQRNTVTGPGRKVNLPFLHGLAPPSSPIHPDPTSRELLFRITRRNL